jgi:hypothetical protein
MRVAERAGHGWRSGLLTRLGRRGATRTGTLAWAAPGNGQSLAMAGIR